MGCCSSKKKVRIRQKYKVNERKPGQGRQALKDFQTIGLTDAEIDYLYNIFLSIDRDGSGEIDVGEFYGHFDLDRTPYSDRMFETMDLNSSGEVDFREFVLMIWFTSSMDTRSLPDFLFTLYDHDHDGLMHKTEIREMVKEVYGHLYETNPHIRAITREIEAGQKEQLNLDEFKALVMEHAVLLFPAFRVQQQLRREVFDEDFWRDQLKERMKRGVNFTTFVQETLDRIRDFEKAKLTGKSVLAEKKKKVRAAIPKSGAGAAAPDQTAKKPVIAAKGVTGRPKFKIKNHSSEGGATPTSTSEAAAHGGSIKPPPAPEAGMRSSGGPQSRPASRLK